MAESAYHMEALRRQRVIDRKRAALDKMVNGGSQVCKIISCEKFMESVT